ncbi:arginine N-succinyltransferase [Larsenimonas rhizosphaerae]|uniref:Arginine N-succinyltransferase n=1 Tax=Larsenimonas rhizosphaerae TaxID=2944682 RepID=A0AA41ZC59_9GAMM|nr:arginine N-succinyltransferase [Larsenimonas rhizosphaerae]MCM2129933.1 arginine N-succinyltransferase [Larsenimonas rhizosphaerae]MCX2522632.1 arginine N-succinyltransferase [Larsenimonas rhizosphaerae]
MILRPIRPDDLDQLHEMAIETGAGFTSLPDNRDFLAERIAQSCAAFEQASSEGAALYFFVLEDVEQQALAGCCAIEARVGLEAPFYSYRVGRIGHSSPRLGLHRVLQTLSLSSDHIGDAEVCSLYLRPDWRRDRLGVLLSRSRWLFMAQHRALFPERVFAEMRGVLDEHGSSPFWRHLGRHFLPLDFHEADRLTGLGEKSFIGELMPKHPICVSLLPEELQEGIGKVHHNTRPALAMLNREGLRWEGYIDLFDAGPTVESYLDDVAGVCQSRLVTVTLGETVAVSERPSTLVASTGCEAFRVIWASHAPADETLALTEEELAALGVSAGDTVRILAS